MFISADRESGPNEPDTILLVCVSASGIRHYTHVSKSLFVLGTNDLGCIILSCSEACDLNYNSVSVTSEVVGCSGTV